MSTEAVNGRKKADAASAEAQAERDRILKETFVQEGTMVAFPLCFPGATSLIRPDESRIVALDVTSNGLICGVTAGRAAHLFSGQVQAATGALVDHGIIEGATGCSGICALKSRMIAAVDTPEGGRLVSRKLQRVKADLLQEWSFPIEPVELSEPVEPGSRIESLVRNAKGTRAVGRTGTRLFTVADEPSEIEWLGGIEADGPLAVMNDMVFSFDGKDALWCFELEARNLARKAIPLPSSVSGIVQWAVDAPRSLLYASTRDGRLLCIDPLAGSAREVGHTPLIPVTAMAVTHDGRLFGTCGEGIQQLFVYEPGVNKVRSLGAAVSVIERRRYGYEYAAAVTGPDGQIFFGENDDLGHLWIYFPRILA